MHPKVVVVALPSPSKTCSSCGQVQKPAAVLCPQCGLLQPVPVEAPNYFELFNLSPQLKVDVELLRSRFYELAQLTHPDKYSQSDGYQRTLAARWSTLINKANQTLRDPRATSQYLLDLYSVPDKEDRSLPSELAEAYFELQDLLAEKPDTEAIQAFKTKLLTQKTALQKEWNEIADSWPTTSEKLSLLVKLREQLNKDKYLSSMLADLNNKWELS